jgi:hypothetical protein
MHCLEVIHQLNSQQELRLCVLKARMHRETQIMVSRRDEQRSEPQVSCLEIEELMTVREVQAQCFPGTVTTDPEHPFAVMKARREAQARIHHNNTDAMKRPGLVMVP